MIRTSLCFASHLSFRIFYVYLDLAQSSGPRVMSYVTHQATALVILTYDADSESSATWEDEKVPKIARGAPVGIRPYGGADASRMRPPPSYSNGRPVLDETSRPSYGPKAATSYARPTQRWVMAAGARMPTPTVQVPGGQGH
ncbi:hypothetical protein K523DRAFT_391669 [Schizophyllum commune Tattone D]|nr:hypothetical protein K523DRAFT_391669 [Schizophyllum commune Tattone D]